MTGETQQAQARIVGVESLPAISALNETIFGESRIINSFDREDLLLVLADIAGEPVGFKVGYRQSRHVFYSAKGGVLESCRRRGIADALLDVMLEHVRAGGYRRFAFDTFPNRHPGMAVMALSRGYKLTEAEYNTTYADFRLRFELDLKAGVGAGRSAKTGRR
jgi:GNAT superfamily N-acetyltransferase